MISSRTRESAPPLLVLLAIVVMAVLLYARIAHAAGVGVSDPTPAAPPFNWGFWSGVLLAVATAGSYVLHALAAKRHSATLETIANGIDTVRLMAKGAPEMPPEMPLKLIKPPAGTGTAVMLVVVLLGVTATAGASLTSCAAGSTARTSGAAGLVAALNCEDSSIDPAALADAEGFAAAKVQAWVSGVAPADLATLKSKILADLTSVKTNLGRCAIAGALAVVAAVAAPKPTPGVATSALLAAGPDPALIRAAFAGAARSAGWAPVRLASGEVL